MRNFRQFFLTTLVLLCSALTSWAAPYSGTPSATLYKITASNYTNYGFTAENWQAFENYYAIASAEDLYKFAAMVNGRNNYIKGVLTADIVVNENVLTAEGTLNGTPTYSWTPIGTFYISEFNGKFDGNGHTISGLYYNNPDDGNYVGLIGCADGATIKNVGVIDSYIFGLRYVGGICGGGGTQINCYNTGTVLGSAEYVGGICGYSGTQTNCYNTGTVSGSNYVGGICGQGYSYNYGTTVITNCYNTGTVSGSSEYVGGICGYKGTKTNCYYLASSCPINDGGTSATAEEFASGKITYLLNGSTSGDGNAWRQNLDNGAVDAYPVLDNTHGVVYILQPCTVFGNTDVVKEHPSMTATGYCTACGQFIYQGTTLVTESNYSSLNLTADFVGYYAISNTAELYWFANEVNNGNNTINAVLTADITVNENVLNNDGTLNGTPTFSWTPIGTSSNNFKGTFDGNGHTISGLYFNNTTDNGGYNVGLIGYANGATIKNVGVIDSYLNGYKNIGGICGFGYDSHTTITNCYNTGTVSGSSNNVGGICGYEGKQTNCYNTGTVSGSSDNAGGICGYSYYSTNITNCYYLSTCGSKNTLGVSATAEEFASGKITYLLNGSTSGNNNTWRQTLDNGAVDAYPVLDNSHGVVYRLQPCTVFGNTDVVKEHPSMDATGRCTACGQFLAQGTLVTEGNYSSYGLTADFIDYYAISNTADLYWFANEVNNGRTSISAVLTKDIKVNTTVLNADGTLNGTPTYSWTPIGTSSNNFKGTFDGNGHTISGLYFENTTISDYPAGGNYVGLIGRPNGATIKNVGVIDSYIRGYQYVGGICGYCYSSKTTITNCYNTGTVSGFSYVGGICGNGLDTYIAKCYNTGTVSGSYHYVGGICGRECSVTNCYNTGTVSGTSSVGGICGSEGTQTNCYNTGTVSVSGYNPSVGGICGENGTQNNCYYLAGCGSKNNLGVSTTADEFASGKITYLLNGSTSGGNIAWRQTLGNGNDAYPVLDNTHAVVYATQPCTSEFSNTAGVVKEHPSMNTIGHCTACDKFITQGTLVTVSNYGSLNLTADFVGYYAISNSAELYWFADKVNTNGGTSMNAVLTADIVVNEKVLKADGTLNGIPTYDWTPIGTSTYRYEGTFDGNGHTISGLYLVYTTNDYYPAGGKCVGLIGYASGATIKNVGVVDSYLYGYQYVGGICGLGLISTNITNCYNTGTVSGYYSYSYAGGICGSCSSSATQTNCYSTGAVSGTNVIGGICGGGGTQTNCYYLAGSCSVSGGGVSATAAELASGKIACLLNNGESTIWRQDLYSDALPSFDVGKNPATGYIVEDGDTYTVVGDMFLATNYEIPEGKTLNVLEGTSLTTTGEAVITNNGTMVCNGTIAGNNLAGNGTFVTNRLSLCSISNLNESYVYKSTAYTLEAGLSEVAVNTTILGKTFTLDATISPSYANNRNVGTATISWTNNADENDVLSGQFEITPKTLAISNIKAENKVYDGNTTTTVSYTADVFNGDVITFGTAATFADKNVGTGKAVSFNYTKSGADAANYAFANETGETTANITPKNLTVSNITANGKVYDGNVTTEGSYSYDADIVDGDEVTVNYTAAFEDKNVGTNKRVDFSFTKTGADAGNYQFTNATDHATANITARTLTLSNFVANGKTYDGTTNATGGAFSDNRVSGDVLGFKYDYSFENKNVGTNKNVNFSDIAISGGADKGNYTLAATTGAAKADITVKTLAISNIAAASKTYDGNTTTTVSYTADVFSGDDVTFGTAATFDNKNAGTDKQVTFNYTKSGADAANYAFANESGSTTANIEPRELAISSVSAAGKEYDGNTATTVTIAASNIVSGDVVTFGTAAAFDDKNVGTNKTVNFTYTKSGADAANYSFAQATGTAKANITARTLTLSNFVANGKTYDGTTNATGGAFSDNRVSGDVLQFTYDYSFENKNVGTNKNVNFSNIAISGGADKGNYTLAATTGAAKADITVKTLAISNIKAENKTYDGNTTTSVSYTTDKVATDDVTFGTTATFADKNVGNGKAVSFNYTKSGADAANYAFANATGSTTANITPRELAISSVSAASKEYDGNTATTVTIAASNIVSGDVVTFGTAAAFADKNVGTNKTVNFTYTKSGADAANYSFAQANGTATAAISARELSLSNFVAADKVYDGTVAGSGSFSDDRVSGDVLEFSYTVEFDDENANTDIDVYFRNIAISGGADKDNYTLLTTSGTGSAKISPVTDEVVITITLADKSVVYSGAEQTYNAADALTIEADNALYNLDWVSESGNAASVSGTNAGEYAFGWNAEMFSNSSANFTNVTFNVTDGKLIITPKTGVVVTITENSGELNYNTEEQSVSGYTVTNIEDETGVYTENDFTFSGNAVATGTTVGTYPMELSAADFSNTNANFADVRFVIVDGALTITKAPAAPNKPEAAMETRYIVTQLVALPENWKWADEQQALEEGSNVATANYVGADKGNYVIESVDVTITRLECLHNEGNEVLYTLEPTCTHKGYTGNLSCKLCGEIYEMGDSIPALGHDFVETVVAPTCTTDGYTTHFCARDNYTEYSDTVPATGHKEDVAVFENIVAATCTEAGSQDSVVYCSVCKEELSRTVLEIPATGHKDSVVIENIVRPTLEAAGSYDSVVYCSVCKVELSRKTIDVLASAVAVSKLPNKVEYKQGEALDVKGGKLTATYSDESTAEFEMLAGWVSGFDSEKVGKQTLTVKFETVSSTLTTTFDVTVNAKDDDNTAIDEDAAEISIYAYSNIIVVEAADAITGEIAVFDVNGRMVRKTLAAGTRTEIEMPRQGLYIVRYGNQAKRVVIK